MQGWARCQISNVKWRQPINRFAFCNKKGEWTGDACSDKKGVTSFHLFRSADRQGVSCPRYISGMEVGCGKERCGKPTTYTLCQYSPVKTQLEEPRSCVAGAAEWTLILTIRRRERRAAAGFSLCRAAMLQACPLVPKRRNAFASWSDSRARARE